MTAAWFNTLRQMLIDGEGVSSIGPFADEAAYIAAKGSAAAQGDVFFNSTDLVVQIYNGTGWQLMSGLYNNTEATTAPTASNDDSEGYEVGSLWMDVTADAAYIMLDASTGAAIWQEIVKKSYVDTKVSLTGAQYVDGVKAFSSFPLLPAIYPTTMYQAAHKGYIDDKFGTGTGHDHDGSDSKRVVAESLDSSGGIYIGTQTASVWDNGAWRLSIVGGTLAFQKKITGTWVTQSDMGV